jgi:putative phosphoribosyl transferase
MMEIQQFSDRTHAGQLLARKLAAYQQRQDLLVLALPRGGVPVAFEVAKALHAPLDILIIRKLGVPGNSELAMGAIASGNVRVMNEDVVRLLYIDTNLINQVIRKEQQELERREHLYRGGRPAHPIQGRTVILIDDGIATGATMHAAVQAVKQQQPARIIIAVPAAPPDAGNEFSREVDEFISVMQPDPFYAVGFWYKHFSQTTDEEVCALLAQANHDQFTPA